MIRPKQEKLYLVTCCQIFAAAQAYSAQVCSHHISLTWTGGSSVWIRDNPLTECATALSLSSPVTWWAVTESFTPSIPSPRPLFAATIPVVTAVVVPASLRTNSGPCSTKVLTCRICSTNMWSFEQIWCLTSEHIWVCSTNLWI